jgi:hypothetical protein
MGRVAETLRTGIAGAVARAREDFFTADLRATSFGEDAFLATTFWAADFLEVVLLGA